MADQKSSDAALSAAVNVYFEKKILSDFEPETSFYSSAPSSTDIPLGGGKTVEWTRYRKVAALYSDDSTEFASQQMYLSAQVVTATLHERSGYVQLSRFVSLTAIGDLLTQAANKVRMSATKSIDKLIRNDIGMIVADKAVYSAGMFSNMGIDGGTLNSSGVTARIWTRRSDGFPLYHNKIRVAQSALVTSIAKSALTVKTIQHGVSVLQGKDIDPAAGGLYKLITHPEAAYQVTTSAGFKGWFSPTSSEKAKLKPSEVGVIAGTMIETSTQAYKFPLSGDTMSTASGNLYGSLLFGAEAYGVASVAGQGGRSGFEFFLKESGPQTTSDPANKIKQAAFTITSVGRVLNKSAGLWLLSTSQV